MVAQTGRSRQSRSALPAKLSAPRLTDIYPRVRLFKLLDKASKCPVVWVQGPAGAGKTTVVAGWLKEKRLPCLWYQVDAGDGDIASFFYYMGQAATHAAPRHKRPLPLLTTEYLQGVPIFTRRYFEELFRRLKTPAVLVFDNYQDAPLESGFHEMMAHALETIPDGISVVVLSRGEPPPQFSRLQANRTLHHLGWEDVRFTLNESRDLLRAHGRKQPSDAALRALHAKTEGWAAGLVLLLARATTEGLGAHEINHLTASGVFDYFATEIFSRTDPRTRRFLLATAFLPSITVVMARKLTGIGEAGEILERLVRQHYFTEKHSAGEPSYQFHALFREFLLARTRSDLDPDERRTIKLSAANLLQASGRIEDAAGLLISAAAWSALAELIRREAQTLVAQGRSQTLEAWIRAIPEEIRNNDAWLLYRLGMCRMAFDPRESRGLLERAFGQFREERDAAGSFLAWASIIDTFIYEWGDFSPLDHWIAVLDELQLYYPAMPSPEIEVRVAGSMLSAITNRQPRHPDASRWAERVLQIVLTSQNVSLRMALGNQLIFYYLFIGDFSRISVVMDALRPSSGPRACDPLTRQTWYVMESIYAWCVADWPTCLRAIADGTDNAEKSGIHLLDLVLLAQGVYGGLSLGDPEVADACLEKMSRIDSPRLGDKALYQYQASASAWFHGDFRKSAKHAEQSIRITEQMGWPFPIVLSLIGLAVTLFDDGKYDDADASLKRAMEMCQGMTGLEFFVSMYGAWFAFHQNREKDGFRLLERGLTIGARHGILNLPRWNSARMALVLARALDRNIETEYVQKLIRIRGLVPTEGMTGAENWPWPIKIHALGRFEIMVDGIAVSVLGNAQQKPVALLKAIIALGGKDIAEERITDALWPDAEGDRARQSLKITLHRLRRLLGHEEALVVRNGLYSLDARRTWVDAWSLEHVLGKLEATLHDSRHEALPALANRVAGLYRGKLFDMESAPWAVSAGERLRTRFLRVVNRAAEALAARDPAAAIPLYERALEADPLAEGLYQGLMRSCRNVGRMAEGLAAYRRCRDVLKRELDLLPSPATEILREALQGR